MEGNLVYIVPTPIGNLRDITYRAIDILKDVDIIACEDTRHTKILLNKWDIKKKLISYHEFNEEESSIDIVKLVRSDKKIALVSDAGMPSISDPGYILINRLKKENISYTVLPGPSASILALVLSGLPNDRFQFFGFLPRKNKDLDRAIMDIENSNITTIIYESPKRVNSLMEIFKERIPDRKICIAREMTKIHEEITFILAKEYVSNSIIEKGEFVLVIEGKKEDIDFEDKDVIDKLNSLKDMGYSNKEAVNILSNLFNIKKNDLYRLSINRGSK